jgi:hypothetical protein
MRWPCAEINRRRCNHPSKRAQVFDFSVISLKSSGCKSRFSMLYDRKTPIDDRAIFTTVGCAFSVPVSPAWSCCNAIISR